MNSEYLKCENESKNTAQIEIFSENLCIFMYFNELEVKRNGSRAKI
jgi:hypothetical protein